MPHAPRDWSILKTCWITTSHAGLTPANVISELKNFTDNFSEVIAFANEGPERYPGVW
jgi:hypothetical protein